MIFDWQTGVALLLVAGAVYFLGRKTVQFVRHLKSGSGCPTSCGGCPSPPKDSTSQSTSSLVSLDLATKSKPPS